MLLLTLLALLAGVAAVLSACGESGPDEFVGTWRQVDYKTDWTPPLVIEKTDDGYRGAFVFNSDQEPRCFDLKRAGDKLKGTARADRGRVEVELIYRSESGRLTWRGPAVVGGEVLEVEFVKVSDSTAHVTPPPS